jgi:pimeloyl-ACP methyl ester carboxylesterase
MNELLSTRGGDLALHSHGNGRPLFLLPANGRAAQDFDPIVDPLLTNHRVTTFDWPSMGNSPPAADPHTVGASSLADILEEVIEQLVPSERVVLVGHSVGGFAAARYASRFPERIQGLVLIDSGGFADLGPLDRAFCHIKGTAAITRATEARFARWHTAVRNEETERMVARVEAIRKRPGYAETVGAIWRSFADPISDLRSQATAITVPTLLMWGKRDPVIPIACAQTAKRLIPGSHLAMFASGHTPFLETRSEFLAELLPFLESLPS